MAVLAGISVSVIPGDEVDPESSIPSWLLVDSRFRGNDTHLDRTLFGSGFFSAKACA
jgi:hypothetical protein